MKTRRWSTAILAFCSAAAFCQETDIVSQQGKIRVGGVYQSWSWGDGSKLAEFSTPVEIYYPFNRQTSLNVNIGQASATGKDMQKLGGLADAQFALNYHLEDQNVLLTLGGNLPTGKKELTLEEFTTSVFLSQNLFGFQVPVFGQGFNLSPGFTWAKPMGEKTVAGFGASYLYKGGYVPVKDVGTYKPGSDMLVTGGMDYQISELTAMSFDLTVTLSGKDKLDTAEVFKAGTKVMAAAQYRQYFNRDLLWLFMRFRSRGKSDVLQSNQKMKMQPDELEFLGTFRKRINPTTSLSYLFEARSFLKNADIGFEGAIQAGPGLSVAVQTSPAMSLQGRVKYLYGKITNADKAMGGIEVGAWLEYAFNK
jgi:hypothetical protein